MFGIETPQTVALKSFNYRSFEYCNLIISYLRMTKIATYLSIYCDWHLFTTCQSNKISLSSFFLSSQTSRKIFKDRKFTCLLICENNIWTGWSEQVKWKQEKKHWFQEFEIKEINDPPLVSHPFLCSAWEWVWHKGRILEKQ